MMKKIYLCDIDKDCPDYIFTKEIIEDKNNLLVNLEDAELCIFNAGVFISKHNATEFKRNLTLAIEKGKEIVVTKPYGTSYMPLYIRRLNLKAIELLYSQINAIIQGIEPDSEKILFKRYC